VKTQNNLSSKGSNMKENLGDTVFSKMVDDIKYPPSLIKGIKDDGVYELHESLTKTISDIKNQSFVTDEMYKTVGAKTLNMMHESYKNLLYNSGVIATRSEQKQK
jgi:hypothetical protein